MSRMVTTARRFVERSAWVIAAPWAAAIGIILLLHWFFDVVRVVAAPPGEAAQRLDRRTEADIAVLNQTSPVYSMPFLTHTDHGSYGPAATRPEWVPPFSCGHRVHGSDAIVFERELGDRLFCNPRAAAAARCTVKRLFEVMRVLHTELHPGTTPRRTEQIFFSDRLTNPGQVGRGVVALPELLRGGNLRMVMTALLNATHDSKDPMTVEMTIQELLKRRGWEEVADRAGLDVARLHALKEMVDPGHGVFAVPALGSHSPDAWGAVTECVASQAARWRRTPADREAYRWTAREFADRGIALHPLEVAAQRHAAASQPIDDPAAGLHWESGRALFGIDTEAPVPRGGHAGYLARLRGETVTRLDRRARNCRRRPPR